MKIFIIGDEQLSGLLDPWFPVVVAITLAALLVLVVLRLVGWALHRSRLTHESEVNRRSLWGRLVLLVTLLCVAALATTSFFTIFRFGAMHGWWLLAHMFASGAFIAILPILALTFAIRSEGSWLSKFSFWLLLVGGVIVIGTMLLSMFPIYGTDTLLDLITAHRYAGLLVVTVLVIFLISRRSDQSDDPRTATSRE